MWPYWFTTNTNQLICRPWYLSFVFLWMTWTPKRCGQKTHWSNVCHMAHNATSPLFSALYNVPAVISSSSSASLFKKKNHPLEGPVLWPAMCDLCNGRLGDCTSLGIFGKAHASCSEFQTKEARMGDGLWWWRGMRRWWLGVFHISISHIDYRYIDTFWKYRYRYRYR